MTMHMRDPGYSSAKGIELFQMGGNISDADCDTIFRRALCSLKWLESWRVTNAWRRVTCRSCQKKQNSPNGDER